MAFLTDLVQQMMQARRGRLAINPVVPIPLPLPLPAAPVVPAGPTPEQLAAEKRAADITRARADAERRAEMSIRERGLDPAAYMGMVRSEFDRVQSTIDPLSDPRNAFGDNIASSLLTGEEARRKQEYSRQANEKFGSGVENRDIPSSLLDDTINDILSGQRKSASDYLERGKARGIYNDVGYNAGLSALGTADSMGRAELSSLGGTVIDKYRSAADKVGDKAFGDVSGYSLGNNFSLDPYVSEYQDILGRAGRNAGGDLRGLLGGRNFFDLSKLGQSAGQAQGAINLRDTDVATALNERRRTNSMSRGLGSQGAF